MLREPTTLAKEKLFCVSCSHSHQTIGLLLLSALPTMPPKMDKTGSVGTENKPRAKSLLVVY
jgi:hypothetical protein